MYLPTDQWLCIYAQRIEGIGGWVKKTTSQQNAHKRKMRLTLAAVKEPQAFWYWVHGTYSVRLAGVLTCDPQFRLADDEIAGTELMQMSPCVQKEKCDSQSQSFTLNRYRNVFSCMPPDTSLQSTPYSVLYSIQPTDEEDSQGPVFCSVHSQEGSSQTSVPNRCIVQMFVVPPELPVQVLRTRVPKLGDS